MIEYTTCYYFYMDEMSEAKKHIARARAQLKGRSDAELKAFLKPIRSDEELPPLRIMLWIMAVMSELCERESGKPEYKPKGGR